MNISGSLPKEDGNGLEAVYDELRDQPREKHVAVCIVDGKSSKFDADTGVWTVTARIRRIEVISDTEDRSICEKLMRRALDKRTGREALPYDLEEELREVFENASPDDDSEADE